MGNALSETGRRVHAFVLACFATTLATGPAAAQDKFIVMASTTSTEQTGLFSHLLPAFKKASGIDVRVVALGTGQALDTGRRGDADVLLVHDKAAEEKFVSEGFGLPRRAVMYNDFVLVGPAADPAGAKSTDIVAALVKLASSNAAFVSRADKSGTHAAELRYWKAAGFGDPALKIAGKERTIRLDYRAWGCGMGAAINIASSTDAYTLTDRGSWLSFKNRGDLKVLVQGDKRLFNQYGVIVVDAARFPHAKTELAKAFSDWVVSADGQAAIAAYKISGEQLFYPNAAKN